jgi:hypothetical protein
MDMLDKTHGNIFFAGFLKMHKRSEMCQKNILNIWKASVNHGASFGILNIILTVFFENIDSTTRFEVNHY